MIEFTIPLEPQGKGRPRASTIAGKARLYTPKRTRAHEGAIAFAVREHYDGPPLEGPLCLELLFVVSRPKRLRRKKDPEGLIPHDKKPDLDNLVKAALDGLTQAGIWRDDAQVARLTTEKVYAEKDGLPRIQVRLEKR